MINKLAQKQYDDARSRILNLKNRGLDICSEYAPDTSSSFNSVRCDHCGYSSEIHTIRDLIEIIHFGLKVNP